MFVKAPEFGNETTDSARNRNTIANELIETTDASSHSVINVLDLNRMVSEIERKLISGETISDFKRDDQYPKMNGGNLKIQFTVSKKEYTLLLKATVHGELDKEQSEEKGYNIYKKSENFASLQFGEDECEVDNNSIIISALNETANNNGYQGNLYVYMTKKDGTIVTSHRNLMNEEEITEYENISNN